MVGFDFMDEIDGGNFFDQMDDIIDFPADNGCGLGSGGCNDFPGIWSNPSDLSPGSGQIFSDGDSNGSSDPSAELSFPCEDIDIVNLNWLSDFVDVSLTGRGVMTLDKENASDNKERSHNQFQTSSPVSVLESSISSSSSSSSSSICSGGKIMPLGPIQPGTQRARSKRPRPATFNPRPAIQLISPTSSVTENTPSFPVPVASSESENFAKSPPVKKIPNSAAAEHKKKRKKMKLSIPLAPVGMNQNPAPAVRKCAHCEITKTPQWRAGPMGPKTLCNACGVRYKSGRLFPEYRPAASPTFVPALHSNSHKKVLEMRIKGGDQKHFTVVSATTTQSGLAPSSNPSPDYI